MRKVSNPEQPCYSLRLVQPFVGQFASYFNTLPPDQRISPEMIKDIARAIGELFGDQDFAARVLRSLSPDDYSVRFFQPLLVRFVDDFKKLDLDSRIPMALAHKLLNGTIEFTGDPDFGLKAGCSMSAGDIGALDYAMMSAATVQEAIDVAARYIRLINDGLDLRLEIDGGRAVVRLDSQVVLPKAAEAFQLSAFYSCNSGTLLQDVSGMEFWFTHAEPADATEYHRIFSPATVRFAAPCCGIVFDSRYVTLPLKSANTKLHSVLRRHADLMLAELPSTRNVTDVVRNLITKELPHGQLNLARIASQLNMSSRTLERRLGEEGTTFKELLEDLRRRLAYRYVVSQDVSLAEVTFLLGYSASAAFHRAFKRWTGQTPLEYRSAHRL